MPIDDVSTFALEHYGPPANPEVKIKVLYKRAHSYVFHAERDRCTKGLDMKLSEAAEKASIECAKFAELWQAQNGSKETFGRHVFQSKFGVEKQMNTKLRKPEPQQRSNKRKPNTPAGLGDSVASEDQHCY